MQATGRSQVINRTPSLTLTPSHLPISPLFPSLIPTSHLSFYNLSDVSMNGHNCGILLGGQFFPVDGTSASAPFFAAFVTLMNDIRLLAGNSPLGFLNPLIYSFNSSHFNGDLHSPRSLSLFLTPLHYASN